MGTLPSHGVATTAKEKSTISTGSKLTPEPAEVGILFSHDGSAKDVAISPTGAKDTPEVGTNNDGSAKEVAMTPTNGKVSSQVPEVDTTHGGSAKEVIVTPTDGKVTLLRPIIKWYIKLLFI